MASENESPPSGRSLNGADSMPAAKLGMWLFLASEAMFFIGLLSAFIVLGSGVQHELFAKSSAELNYSLGILQVILLVSCSGLLVPKPSRLRLTGPAIAMATFFFLLQIWQWQELRTHHTCVVRMNARMLAIDGFENWTKPTQLDHAKMIDLPRELDAHAVTRRDFSVQEEGSMTIQDGAFTRIQQDLNYGPSRNNFFACYFLMSTAHVVHLLAGMIAVLWYLIFAKGRVPAAVQIYWHFVNAVGVIGILALYFV